MLHRVGQDFALAATNCIMVPYVPLPCNMAAKFLDLVLPAIISAGYSEIAEYMVRAINVDRRIFLNLPDIISLHVGKGILIADSNTVQLLDRKVLDSVDCHVIQGEYCASIELVESVQSVSVDADFIIALGSGSINDICKYVSHISNKEYILFPTAPSVNGYTSPNASIVTRNGIKKSLAGALPRAIYADIDVLRNAPRRMITSGFMDFMCRSVVRLDWLLSHLLLNTEYSEVPFLISEASENALVENYRGLIDRDDTTVMLLMEALLLSGIGMLIVGGSQSASQGEHIIASATELLDDYDFLHGERVGVATIIMAQLQRLICSTRPKLYVTSLNKDALVQYFGPDCAHEFCETLLQKEIDLQKAEYLNYIIAEKWEYISEKVEAEVLNPRLFRDMFEYLGCPNVPEHVGWRRENYREIANIAFATRDRFTFLDLAHHAQISVM